MIDSSLKRAHELRLVVAVAIATIAAVFAIASFNTDTASAWVYCAPTGAHQICAGAGAGCDNNGVCAYGYDDWTYARLQEISDTSVYLRQFAADCIEPGGECNP